MKKIYKESIQIRRYLHQYPEVSNNEFETAKYLKTAIKKLGLETVDVGDTGFYTIINTNKPGKTVICRSELDALPIHENPKNLVKEKTVISKIDGVSHACGHDGHMAIMFGVLKSTLQNIDNLKGKIIFAFEQAEETGGGIDYMIEALAPLKPDVILGNHLAAFMEIGEVSCLAGPVMAGVSIFNIHVEGREGHSSRPDLTINPIVVGSSIISNVFTAWHHQLDMEKVVTLGVSQFHAGNQDNIIPKEANISGTIRFFDLEEGKKALNLIENVSRNVGLAHNAKVSFEFTGPRKPVINDHELARLYQEMFKESRFEDITLTDELWYASETFSSYSEIAPSVFVFIGIKNDELGSGSGHHTAEFDLDEKSIEIGIDITSAFVEKLLG